MCTHFQKLALPLTNENFDDEYKELVDQDIESIITICETEERDINPVTEEEVQKALSRLKNNKAMDSMGLCSEHLKLGATSCRVLNRVIKCSDQGTHIVYGA